MLFNFAHWPPISSLASAAPTLRPGNDTSVKGLPASSAAQQENKHTIDAVFIANPLSSAAPAALTEKHLLRLKHEEPPVTLPTTHEYTGKCLRPVPPASATAT
jgi:hypothetical protein